VGVCLRVRGSLFDHTDWKINLETGSLNPMFNFVLE
jgi:hypothetical protein